MAAKRSAASELARLEDARARASTQTDLARRQLDEARRLVQQLAKEVDEAQEGYDQAMSSARDQGKARLGVVNADLLTSNKSAPSSGFSDAEDAELATLRAAELETEGFNPWAIRVKDVRGVAFIVRLLVSPQAASPRAEVEITWDAASPMSDAACNSLDTFTGPAVTPGEDDWIALYPVGSEIDFESLQSGHRWLFYVDGRRGATIRANLPSVPGRYVVRYVHESGVCVAESTPITVRAPPLLPSISSTSTPGLPPAGERSKQKVEVEKGLAFQSQAVPLSISVNAGDILETGAPARLVDVPRPTDTSQAAILPPFLLEKHARISVYTLCVPLPACFRVAGKPAADKSPSSVVRLLPDDWAPSVRVFGDSAAAVGAGEKPGVEVIFQLPRVGQATDAYTATDLDVQDMRGNSHSMQLYRLVLPLSHRIESGACGAKVFADHFSLRLPLFYAGSAVPERPSSLITGDETLSLRRQGRRVSCRACGNLLMRPFQAHKQACVEVGSSRTEWGMRAFLLPSDHWLEWSEFWLCHETGPNIFIPDTDFGAKRGVLLLGETHLAVHPGDVRPEAVRVVPEEGSVSVPLTTATINGGSPPVDSSPESGRVGGERVRCTLHCARCAESLGDTSYTGPGAATGPSFVPPTLADGVSRPDTLSAEADLVLHFHKDRLSAPLDADPEPAGTALGPVGPVLGVRSLRSGPADALAHYGVSSRLCTKLLAAAQARSQYRFLILDSEAFGNAAAEVEAVWGCGPPAGVSMPEWESLHAAARVRAVCSSTHIVLVLMNWNASVRAWPQARTGADTSVIRAEYAPFCTGRDMPVLQLQYVHVRGDGGEAVAVGQWAYGEAEGDVEDIHRQGHGHEEEEEEGGDLPPPEPVGLLSHEIAEIKAVLDASNLLRPPSTRILGVRGALESRTNGLEVHLQPLQLGYLPFRAAVPSDT